MSSELTQELDKFVSKETENFHNENGEDAIKLLESSGDEEIGNIAEKWAKAFTQVVSGLAKSQELPVRYWEISRDIHNSIHNIVMKNKVNCHNWIQLCTVRREANF